MRTTVLLVTGLVAGLAACSDSTGTRQVYTPNGPITLPAGPVTTIEVSPSKAQLHIGATSRLKALAKDATGLIVSNVPVSWSSSDPLVASVSDSGVLVAKKLGTATVSASADNISASASITVSAVPVASVAVTLGSSSIEVGGTATATAVVKDSSGGTLTDRVVTWSSSAPGVATVGIDGRVTAVGAGSARISAATEGISGGADITVTSSTQTPAPVASVTVTLNSSVLTAGQSTQANVILKDASGNVLTGRNVSWTSSATSIATVSGTGLVQAVSAGSAAIRATSEGVTGQASITVSAPSPPPVATVTVTLASSSVTVGQPSQATAVLKDANGNVLTGRTVTWTSSNTSVASVSANGLATALAAGTTNIVATSGGVSGQALLTVAAAPPAPVASVTVTLRASSLSTGQTTQATAVLKDAAGNVLSGRTTTWSSSNTSVATVNGSGLVTAVSAGSANISATSEGVSGQAALSVAAPAPVATVTVSLSSTSIVVGQTAQASVVLKDASGNVLTGRTVTWASGSTAIATVNGTGLVTSVAAGSAKISATSEGQSGSATLTVTAPTQPPPTGDEPIYVAGVNNEMYYEDFETYTSSSSFSANGWASANSSLLSAPAASGYGGGRAAQMQWPAGTETAGMDRGVDRDGEGRVAIFSFMYRTSAGFKVDNVGKKFAIMNLGDPDRVTTGLSGLGGDGAWDLNISGLFNGNQDIFAQPNVQAFSPQSVGEYVTNGNWHRITIRRTRSSSGHAADGSIEIWVDGVRTHNLTGLALGTQPILNVEFSGTWNNGSPQTQSEFFDNVRIWYP